MSTSKVQPVLRVAPGGVGGSKNVADRSAASVACEPARTTVPASDAFDAAAKGLGDAFRVFVREAVRDELARFKEDLLAAFRRPHAPANVGQDADGARLLSVAEVASRVGAAPATVREWIKDGYLTAVALGPAGRKYGLRWADVEASLARRDRSSIPMDMDAEASQIVGAARARAARRKGA